MPRQKSISVVEITGYDMDPHLLEDIEEFLAIERREPPFLESTKLSSSLC